MAGLTLGGRAAAALLEQKEVIARSVTGLLYAEMPWLVDKYGERGRLKCLQDMRYNLEYLAPAVELEDAELFVRYARWVDGVLSARGIPTGELARSFELMANDVRARLRADEAALVSACLEAGVIALRQAGGE
jgi:Phycobilisome protein